MLSSITVLYEKYVMLSSITIPYEKYVILKQDSKNALSLIEILHLVSMHKLFNTFCTGCLFISNHNRLVKVLEDDNMTSHIFYKLPT